MRFTGHWLVVLGLVLLVFAWMTIGAGIISEGLDRGVGNRAMEFAERLSRDELARAFDRPVIEVPEDPAARLEWVERRLDRDWSRGVRRFPGQIMTISAFLGIACVIWGVAEMRATRCRLKTADS